MTWTEWLRALGVWEARVRDADARSASWSEWEMLSQAGDGLANAVAADKGATWMTGIASGEEGAFRDRWKMVAAVVVDRQSRAPGNPDDGFIASGLKGLYHDMGLRDFGPKLMSGAALVAVAVLAVGLVLIAVGMSRQS